MPHHADTVWLKDALVFLFAAGILVPALRVVRIPMVLGFLLAGVALGPHGLGALAASWAPLEFVTISDPETAAPFAELGVLFLLFLLGLELSFNTLWSLRKAVFGAGGLQAGLSALVIGLVAALAGLPAPAAVAVGLALALSSTAVVMQIIGEQRQTAAPIGRTALAVLLFQDILVAPILILVNFLTHDADANVATALLDAAVEGAIALVIIVLVGRFGLRRIFQLAAQAGGREFLMAITLLTLVGAAVLTAAAGLSLALGAFLAGLLLGETEFKHQAQVDLEPFKGLLLSLFFMTVGMGLNLASLAQSWPIILSGLVGLLLVKGVIAALACRLFAGRWPLALESAFILAPAGEFAFVILAAASAGSVVSAETATIITAIAGLSMLTTPLLARAGHLLAAWLEAREGVPPAADEIPASGHVVIAGFGRVGQAIANILAAETTELVALDRNPRLVAEQRKAGWRVFLGDASHAEILRRAGAETAALFVVTVDDHEAAEAMVRAVRALRPHAPLLVRARDVEHAAELEAAGASFVIPEAIEAGLQIAARALEEYGYVGETVRDRIAVEREAAYRRAAQTVPSAD